MSFSPDRIRVNGTYRRGEQRQRKVLAIENGEVIYSIRGLASLVPRRASLPEFTDWVETEITS